MDRLVLVAPLKPGSRARAAELIAVGPPFEVGSSGFVQHSVFLSSDEIVFVFEAPGAEYLVQDIVNDPDRSTGFSAWRPLLDGIPHLAYERWHWNRVEGIDAHRPPGSR
jgi:hypothetical protein